MRRRMKELEGKDAFCFGHEVRSTMTRVDREDHRRGAGATVKVFWPLLALCACIPRTQDCSCGRRADLFGIGARGRGGFAGGC